MLYLGIMISPTKDRQIPVLFVLPTLGTGGSERVVFNLCLHLGPQYLPIVTAFRDGPLRKDMSNAGIQVHVLNRRGGIDFMLIVKLVRLIRIHKIKILNSHHFVSLFYAFWVACLADIAIIHTEHSKWEMEALTPFWNCWLNFFLKRIDLVSAVSKITYAHIKEIYNVEEKRLALVLNGIDVNLFKKCRAKTVSRESIGLRPQDIVIGTVGNLRKEKNQGLLIRALAIMKDRGRSFKALFIGDGPCRSDLEILAAELKVDEKVIFLGTRRDVPHLYGLLDIYCLTSRFEGLPLTLLEAMAAGVPVIGTDVIGISEVISNNKNGLLVPDNDTEELTKAILMLAQNVNLRKAFAEAGRRLVCDRYDFKECVTHYERLFQRFI